MSYFEEPEARNRRARAERRDREGVIPEERRSERMGEEQDAAQIKMWGDKPHLGLPLEQSDEFHSRRLVRWTDL